MGNYYHLLIETPEGNLSRGVRQINSFYAQAFNRCHNRSCPVVAVSQKQDIGKQKPRLDYQAGFSRCWDIEYLTVH